MTAPDLYSIAISQGFESGGKRLITVRADGLASADHRGDVDLTEMETARRYLVSVLARVGCAAASHAKGDDDLPRGGVVGCSGMLHVPEEYDPADPWDSYEPYVVSLYLHVPTKSAAAWVKRLRRWLELINDEQAGA